MANVERLTKRVKKVEEWIEKNEDMGGPQGVLETMTFLINDLKNQTNVAANNQRHFETMRQTLFEFLAEKEIGDDWDKFLKERENAVQEQETESVPVRDESEASEGVREEDAEEQKTTK